MVALQVTQEADQIDEKTGRSLSVLERDLLSFLRLFAQTEERPPSLEDIADGLSETLGAIGMVVRLMERRGLVRFIKPERRPAPDAVHAVLIRLVAEGLIAPLQGSGKPAGSVRPLIPTPGPPLSDYIIGEREALRGN